MVTYCTSLINNRTCHIAYKYTGIFATKLINMFPKGTRVRWSTKLSLFKKVVPTSKKVEKRCLGLTSPLQVTHATRALQSHDLPGEGINFGSHTSFFDHTRTWRASSDEGSAQCQGDTTPSTHPFILTMRILKDDYEVQIIFVDFVGLKRPDTILLVRKITEKTPPRKLLPTGDRTWPAA